MGDRDVTPTALTLAGRLDLLESTLVISPLARRLTAGAIAPIEAFIGRTLEDEAGARLVTHLAMALTRVDRDEPEPPLPDIVIAEIADRVEERELAEALTGEWRAALGRALPEPEVSYLVVHLAVLRDDARVPG